MLCLQLLCYHVYDCINSYNCYVIILAMYICYVLHCHLSLLVKLRYVFVIISELYFPIAMICGAHSSEVLNA